jgi:hypothetical protein
MRQFPRGTKRVPLVRTVVGPPCDDRDADSGTDVAAQQSARGHLVRNGETIQAAFFHWVDLDGESRVAACLDAPRHGQGVKPLQQARYGPVKVPRRPGVIRASNPLGMRRLRKRKGGCAAQAPPRRTTGEPASATNPRRQDRDLSFRARK